MKHISESLSVYAKKKPKNLVIDGVKYGSNNPDVSRSSDGEKIMNKLVEVSDAILMARIESDGKENRQK